VSHMVIYRSIDGKPGFQQTDDLVSAVEFVERLRNLEGVESARIYRLEQVNFRFQPYYQVHLDTAESPTPPPMVAAGPERPAPVASGPAPVSVPASTPSPVSVATPAASTTGPEPVVPRIMSAMAAAADPAPVPPSFEATDPSAPSLGATPSMGGVDPNEVTGIRRGLFGR